MPKKHKSSVVSPESGSARFRQVTILGPGLLGGSVGMAIRKRKLARRVVIWGRRLEAAREAVKKGAADAVAGSPDEAVAGSDLVILCTPVEIMPDLARQFRARLARGAIVTDVGSTKYEVVKVLSQILERKAAFVGAHPMAGSEKDGLKAARANLFDGAVCILTPLPQTAMKAVDRVRVFWERLGCRLRTATPSEHDEWVASISHLPHLTAAALVNSVARGTPRAFDVAGNGFRDTTRVAAGPAEMWTGIILSNREEIRRNLQRLIDELETLNRHITNHAAADLLACLRAAREQRIALKRLKG
ncbi:MAG: prephenate dehydrogenase [Verrucomicrobiae bacterium]|nr:prephenate dehydrogenase [Verrucomicrobiae bacterium]